jgi:hypothetical protein
MKDRDVLTGFVVYDLWASVEGELDLIRRGIEVFLGSARRLGRRKECIDRQRLLLAQFVRKSIKSPICPICTI